MPIIVLYVKYITCEYWWLLLAYRLATPLYTTATIAGRVLFNYLVRTYREICQIIVITITNNNFRLCYVSSKLDQVLLLLLLTTKL
jgi:hypothetical protein